MVQRLTLALLCVGMTLLVGCGDAPETVFETFSRACIEGDAVTVRACVCDEDRAKADALLATTAAVTEERRVIALRRLATEMDAVEVDITDDKAYFVKDGVVDPHPFAVKIDGEWKIDL